MPPPQKIPAILLAAGSSGRMGTLKPLLSFGNSPMIARVIESLSGAFDPILVITGYRAPEVAAAISPYNVTPIHNPNFAAGEMLSSIRTGLANLPPNASAFLLALGDQPAVSPETIRTLLTAHSTQPAPLIIPTFQTKRGHPLLISASLIPEILSLPSTQTLRDLVHRHLPSALQIPVPDPAIIADIDTPADYTTALARWKAQNPSAP